MLTFTLWLLSIGSNIGLIYWHFLKRSKEIKRTIDNFVREAGRLTEKQELPDLLQLHKALEAYGEEFCVNRPWFNIYSYYVEAEWIVSDQVTGLKQVLMAKVRKRRCA